MYVVNCDVPSTQHRLFLYLEKRDEWDSSGQIAYEKACKKYGVILSSTFHNKLRYANSIDLGYYGVGVDGAKAIAVAFCVSLTAAVTTHNTRHVYLSTCIPIRTNTQTNMHVNLGLAIYDTFVL